MKNCRKCKTDKPVEEFSKMTRNKDGLQPYCKLCAGRARLDYYYANHEVERTKINERNQKNKEANYTKIAEYLRVHPCVDCGESDIVVLEFDHIDPLTKIKDVSYLARTLFLWDKIEEEINKCEVRCANCHRRKTHKQFGWVSKA